MHKIGESVMIVGDHRCPIGTVVQVASTVVCDFGTHMATLYDVSPPVTVDGQRMFFQGHHLLSLTGGEEIVMDHSVINMLEFQL